MKDDCEHERTEKVGRGLLCLDCTVYLDYCHGCSKAGDAARLVYHVGPACD